MQCAHGCGSLLALQWILHCRYAPPAAYRRAEQSVLLQEHGEVQLSALGIAIAPMVTIAEILKNRGLAIEKRISTALESLSDDYRQVGAPRMADTATARQCWRVPGSGCCNRLLLSVSPASCCARAGRDRSPIWRLCS